MSTLSELQTFLNAIGTLGLIVVGNLPPKPDEVGVIRSYGGPSPERVFGQTGIKYENPAIQIIFRGAPFDYLGPEAKAYTAWNAIAAITPGQLGSGVATEYLWADLRQSPFPILVKDENNRHHIGFNVYFKKVPS